MEERYFILDKFNTWYDWNLILTSKKITPPKVKTKYVKIDGMDGSLDLTEALTGGVTYEDRSISTSFWTDEGKREDREEVLRKIVNSLHGRKIQIIEPDDPTHYFIGRAEIKGWVNNLSFMEIEIDFTCEPYRYAVKETVRKVDVASQNVTDMILHNGGAKTLTPTITVAGSVLIRFNGEDVTLNTGTYKISNIKLSPGDSIIGVSGTGSATITYRECDL